MVDFVAVEWIDAAFYDKDWPKDRAQKKASVVPCVTAGVYVYSDDDGVCVAQTYGADSYGEMIVIPWGMVTKWYDL